MLVISKIVEMAIEERPRNRAIGDQRYHTSVIVIGTTGTNPILAREGVGGMMTTSVTIDLVIEAIVDATIVTMASSRARAGAGMIKYERRRSGAFSVVLVHEQDQELIVRTGIM